jgi:phosphoserine phosphatase RsbU/P
VLERGCVPIHLAPDPNQLACGGQTRLHSRPPPPDKFHCRKSDTELINVTKHHPSHLRIHSESSLQHQTIAPPINDEIEDCMNAFAAATGWRLEAEAEQVGLRVSHTQTARAKSKFPGKWKLTSVPRSTDATVERRIDKPALSLEDAGKLMHVISRLVNRLESAEETIRRQEAELATSVGVSWKSEEQDEIADRLEAILTSCNNGLKTDASALYILDENTSSLKMRVASGLSPTRLCEGPRDLRGSLADLEALLGNAVVLEDLAASPEWKSPEPFQSGLCVPIGTPTMPHGTLWFWANKPRKFSSSEIEIASLAADRIMCELERSLLGHEVHLSRQSQKQLEAAGLTQASRLPDSQRLHADFQVDGWTFQNSQVGGAFHDWEMNPKGMMTFAVGKAATSGPEGAIVATSLQSALRAMWRQASTPMQVAMGVNDVMWGQLDSNWTSSAAFLQINPDTGYGSVCIAGDIQSFIVSHRGYRPLGQPCAKLAEQPDPNFFLQRFVLQPGEVLVAFSGSVIADLPTKGRKASNNKSLQQDDILNSIRNLLDDSASDIAGHLARSLPSIDSNNPIGLDRSMVVIRNTRKV